MVGSAGTRQPAESRSQACHRACPAHDAGVVHLRPRLGPANSLSDELGGVGGGRGWWRTASIENPRTCEGKGVKAEGWRVLSPLTRERESVWFLKSEDLRI